MSFVDHGQNAVTACIKGYLDGSYTEPFTFVLTPKQTSVIDTRFRAMLWPAPQCTSVILSPAAIAHTVQSRVVKDGMSNGDIGDMLAAIFRKDSEVAVNNKYVHQFHLINAKVKHKDGQLAIGCFQVTWQQGQPTQVKLETAYLAVPAKALGMLGKVGKK